MKGKLDTDTILADDNCEYYKYLLSKSSCLHTVQGQEVEICTSEDRPDNSYGLYFQVAYEVNTLLEQHWRPEDIGILFSVRRLAEPFAKQYNSLNSSSGIQLVSCKYDAPNRIVCDSVRRFSGLEKPCIILVEPAVNEYYFSANKFQALGMSRAMIKLIVIEKKANSSHLRRHNSQN